MPDQPRPLNAISLFASLTVKDIHQSLAWYRDVVGFEVHQQHERGGVLRAVSLKAGTVRILLSQDDGAKGIERAKGEGFSMQLTTPQDIDELANSIKARGGVLASEPADAFGARAFRIVDPDGYRFLVSNDRH